MATDREKMEALVEFAFREGFRYGIISSVESIEPGEQWLEIEEEDWQGSDSCAILDGRTDENHTLEEVYEAWRKKNVDT